MLLLSKSPSVGPAILSMHFSSYLRSRVSFVHSALAGVATLSAGFASSISASEPEVLLEARVSNVNAHQMVQEGRDKFLAANGVHLGGGNAPGDVFVGFAHTAVNVGPDHPGWGQARAAAFERAYIAAQAEFVQFQFMAIATESERALFEDYSQGQPSPQPEPEPEQGQIRRMAQKFLDLTEAKQDEKLIELGLDPADYDGKSVAERQDIFMDSFIRRTTRMAFGELTGCLPWQTLEGTDGTGSHSIGVILLYSPRFRDFASNVLTGNVRPDPARANGRSLMDVIGRDPEHLSRQFGVRRLYDAQGNQVLVSFGQAAVSAGGAGERQVQRRREAAERQARITADSYLAEFLGAQLNLSEESVVGEIAEEYVLTEEDGFLESGTNVRFVNIFNQKLKRRANLKLSGISDAHSWSVRHPEYGVEIVGVVRVWTPDAARAAELIRSGRHSDDSPEDSAVDPAEPGVKQSGNFDGMMPGDF